MCKTTKDLVLQAIWLVGKLKPNVFHTKWLATAQAAWLEECSLVQDIKHCEKSVILHIIHMVSYGVVLEKDFCTIVSPNLANATSEYISHVSRQISYSAPGGASCELGSCEQALAEGNDGEWRRIICCLAIVTSDFFTPLGGFCNAPGRQGALELG